MKTPPAETILYTIGHSDHPLDEFLALLRRHEIAILVDVRSQPYSRWTPQFNREPFARAVEGAGVRYVHEGDALGGRPADPALYAGGAESHPDYARMAATAAFREGLARLLALATERRVAVMCSEGDPHACHRDKLIARQLLERGARVAHILPDGTVEEATLPPQQLALF
jgi:uncharacterized protein (DUF488 family)